MFLLAFVGAALCLWFIKRKKARRRRRLYLAAAHKASVAQEATDLDKPPTASKDDDDIIIDGVNDVFKNPPISWTDRVFNSVAHLFGSKVPLGAARVRTTTGGVIAPRDAVSGAASEGGAPVVLNGRIQALYEEIMKQEDGGTRSYGVLQEEITPETPRRRSSRRSASFRPASELSTVSEISLELMDSGTTTGATATGFDGGHLDLILKGGLSEGVGGELADELELSLPTGSVPTGAGTENTSTGFIADKVNPNKYYSIAFTEYYLDD